MQAKVIFTDGTSTEIPEENLSNMERLLHDKIAKVEYLQEDMDFVNNLAAVQLKEMQEREAKQKAEQAKSSAQNTVQNTSATIPPATLLKTRGRKPNQK